MAMTHLPRDIHVAAAVAPRPIRGLSAWQPRCARKARILKVSRPGTRGAPAAARRPGLDRWRPVRCHRGDWEIEFFSSRIACSESAREMRSGTLRVRGGALAPVHQLWTARCKRSRPVEARAGAEELRGAARPMPAREVLGWARFRRISEARGSPRTIPGTAARRDAGDSLLPRRRREKTAPRGAAAVGPSVARHVI